MAPGRIVLVGMMGSGKTSAGRALAALLGWTYLDNDAALRSLCGGRSAAEVHAREGLDALHEAEARVLRRSLLLGGPRCVVAAPGYVALSAPLRSLLADEVVVWLRARPETIAARVARDPLRPLMGGADLATVAALEAERRPGFASAARVAVDVDDLTVEQVAAEIVSRLGIGRELS